MAFLGLLLAAWFIYRWEKNMAAKAKAGPESKAPGEVREDYLRGYPSVPGNENNDPGYTSPPDRH